MVVVNFFGSFALILDLATELAVSPIIFCWAYNCFIKAAILLDCLIKVI